MKLGENMGSESDVGERHVVAPRMRRDDCPYERRLFCLFRYRRSVSWIKALTKQVKRPSFLETDGN